MSPSYGEGEGENAMKKKRRRRRLGLLRMLFAFFLGVIATLYVLTPGKTGPTVLVSGDRQFQLEQFDKAGQKIEQAGGAAALYAQKAKDFIQGKLGD